MYHSSVVIAAISVFASLASAHGHGAPHILGLDAADLRAREILARFGPQVKDTEHSHIKFTLESRADKPQCGPGIGSCGDGSCCSDHGFCGTTPAFCKSPGCQYEYGPGCPENKAPSGTNTSSFPRTQLGSLAYGGTGIFKCITPGTVALTYDDGPKQTLTNHILDLFKSYNAKGTFFVTGNSENKGPIDVTEEHVKVIKRMDSEGHQIASHTWTHLDLSKNISPVYRRNQMWMNEMALRNIVGKIPTYMRPPYSSCTPESGCQQDMIDLGYHIVYFDVDTDDYQQPTAEKIQNSKDWFKGNITKNGATAAKDRFLSITHDIIEQTANNLTEYMLSTLTQLGYKAVTVGECLGDPKENWYRTADGKNSSSDDKVSDGDGKASGNDNKKPGGDNKTLDGDDKSKSGSTSLIISNHGPMQLIGAMVLFSLAFLHAF